MSSREAKETASTDRGAPNRQPSGQAAPLKGSMDDRGRPIERLNLRELKRTAGRRSDPRAKLAKYIRKAIRAESRRVSPVRVITGLGVAFVVVVCILALTQTFWTLSLSLIFWVCALCLGIASVATSMRWIVTLDSARSVSVTAVAEGVCGSCAYTLEGIVTDSDGCLVCPECGAAWRAERIVRPHWQQGKAAFTDYQPPWYKRLFLGIPKSKDQITHDDRGRFVRILDARLYLLSPVQRAALGPERVRQLRRATFRVGLVWRSLISVVPFTVSATNLGMCIYVLAIGHSEALYVCTVVGGFAVVMFLFGMLTVFSLAFRGPNRVLIAFRKNSICACCGQDIAGLPVDGMGMTACPVCGSGWTLPRLATDVATAAPSPTNGTTFAKADPIEAPPQTR